MTFSLTVLGSSSALPTKNRFPTAHVLNVHERFFLVDCGEGTQIQMRRLGTIKPNRLNHIFISHVHGDHVFGLFGLLSTFDLMGRNGDLHIFGPEALNDLLEIHVKCFGQNMGYKIVFHPVITTQNNIIYEDHCLTVETLPLKHRIPTCGYLFKEKKPGNNIRKEAIEQYNLGVAQIARIKEGADFLWNDTLIANSELTYQPYIPRSYAFCSDTLYNPSLIELIKGVDLLYHEATFLDDLQAMAKQTGHSTAAQAADIAAKAEVKQLLIGHFSSRYDDAMLPLFENEAKQIFPNTQVVKELHTYMVDLVNTRH